MSAAATAQRRQALRNVGKPKYQPKLNQRIVYRGAPLYRQRKAKSNAMHHLYLWLGASAGVVLTVGAMALANWALVAMYGLGFIRR